MITQRFRPVGWVAGVALAATALYLVSLQVASERGRLEAIDRQIAATRRDIRQLQTEMGTRASLRQLERWNGDVLALSAPQAGQFLDDEASLDTFDHDELGRKPPTLPAVMMASAAPVATAAAKAPETNNFPNAIIATLSKPTPPLTLTKQDRTIQAAIAPQIRRSAQVADVALIDRAALDRLARTERSSSEIKEANRQ
jgi:hypothetical protein